MTGARILVVVAVLAAAIAHAQPKHAAGSNAAQARELYKKGMTHYQLGDFDTAIDEFKAAYELTNAPGLLFNLAQVHRMKKDWVQALHFYRMYVRLEPTAPNRADVDALIEECQRAQDEAERAKQPPKVEEAPAPVTPPVVTAPVIVQPPPPPKNWRAKLWIGGAGAAVGLASLAAGIALHVRASDDADLLARDSMAGTNAWDGARQALYSEGQSSATAAIALDVVGVALVAAGVVVGVLGLRERAQAKRFSLAPSGRGAVLACEF